MYSSCSKQIAIVEEIELDTPNIAVVAEQIQNLSRRFDERYEHTSALEKERHEKVLGELGDIKISINTHDDRITVLETWHNKQTGMGMAMTKFLLFMGTIAAVVTAVIEWFRGHKP